MRRYDLTERGEFVAAIQRYEGNLARARRDLGLAHKTMYRYVFRFRLWEDIDRARGLDTRGVDYEKLYRDAVVEPSAPPRHLQVLARALEASRKAGLPTPPKPG